MIKPFSHSVAVSDVPTGDVKNSGLILVGNPGIEHERGVVMSVADDDCPHTKQLKPGDLIYYRTGGCAQIGDVKIVPEDYIIAFDQHEAE